MFATISFAIRSAAADSETALDAKRPREKIAVSESERCGAEKAYSASVRPRVAQRPFWEKRSC